MPETLISIVSPVYRAENIVPELVRRISEEVSKVTQSFEIVLVDDGSPDSSWSAIDAACKGDHRVKGVKLSRNFGQHYAITAGVAEATGSYVVVMDCDLQDDPAYIGALYEAALQGNDVVFTYKMRRKHSSFKNLTAGLFTWLFNLLIDNRLLDSSQNVGSFSLMSRRAANAFLSIREFHRHYLMVLRLIGFKRTYVQVEHQERYEGKSTYTWSGLVSHALDGITSQSDKLLRVSAVTGFALCGASLLWALVLVYQYFHTGLLNGYASLMGFQLLSTGVVLVFLGVIGIYLGKVFTQVKERPLYFIEEKVNF